jgi:NDP-4-keto-2,6-dideoxyhexose 3-C-methyltransferase
LCGNRELVPVLDLGDLVLSGHFPRPHEDPPAGPLELVRCLPGPARCGLAQLRHSYEPGTLYGPHYGYRSGLNPSMVAHLRSLAERLVRLAPPRPDDLVVDIGSNDGTLLGCYTQGLAQLVGVDPIAGQLRRYYRPDIAILDRFFAAGSVRELFPGRSARIVTSVAMFYDLEDPVAFAREVGELLHEDGVWLLEQSYLPSMLAVTAYDTICHEHIEYYAFAQIEWILERAGLQAIEVELNGTNGGSFAVVAARRGSERRPQASVAELRAREAALGLDEDAPWSAFAARVADHRRELRQVLGSLRDEGLTVYGYGASTKGNILLQYCGLDPSLVPLIGEVNEEKFGCVTPGTHIPIVSEAEARRRRPDVFLVLPWHFRDFILAKERSWVEAGGELLFPLPRVERVGRAELAAAGDR